MLVYNVVVIFIGNTNYDQIRSKFRTIKTDSEKTLYNSDEFPNCKGLYPDCPEEPSLDNRMCLNCPKTENQEKPILEDDDE